VRPGGELPVGEVGFAEFAEGLVARQHQLQRERAALAGALGAGCRRGRGCVRAVADLPGTEVYMLEPLAARGE
jgi:hypothetical protein